MRIALLDGFFSDVLHLEVKAVVDATAAVFAGAGAQIESIDGHGIEDARSTWMDVCCPEFAEAHPRLKDPDRRRLVGTQPRRWMEQGEQVTAGQRATAEQRRDEVARWYRGKLSMFDALLIPTTPYPAPGVDQETVDLGGGRSVRVGEVGPGFITCSVNLAGLPALNFPAGSSRGGLPIGVSLVGLDGGEETLLRLARVWEEAANYRPQRPALPVA
jgi:aspartyl-tRNA(Asn)/glutamyl-tRNA(Gln) amidotransferase subunit A